MRISSTKKGNPSEYIEIKVHQSIWDRLERTAKNENVNIDKFIEIMIAHYEKRRIIMTTINSIKEHAQKNNWLLVRHDPSNFWHPEHFYFLTPNGIIVGVSTNKKNTKLWNLQHS